MDHRNDLHPAPSPRLVATLAALSLSLLAGCGGVDGALANQAAAGAAPRASTLAAAPQPERRHSLGMAPAERAAERVAAVAEIIDRTAVPVDTGAHTRRGLYVSQAVAARIDEETGGKIAWVDASCCAGLSPDLPTLMAFSMLAVVGEDAPVYVTGRDLREAARLVDHLDTLGLRRVYLVTP